jgi:hypothetical protein
MKRQEHLTASERERIVAGVTEPAIKPCVQVKCWACGGIGWHVSRWGERETESRCTQCAGSGRILTEGGEL